MNATISNETPNGGSLHPVCSAGDDVIIRCQKTGKELVRGIFQYQCGWCVTVEKTYPNGKRGGVTYLNANIILEWPGGVESADLGRRATPPNDGLEPSGVNQPKI